MKVVVIGIGQCGDRIADEFARMGKRASAHRGLNVVTGVYAVNTDQADLSGLRSVGKDFQHRILLGGRRTGGHGVGKINEIGASIAREGGDKVIDSIRTTKRFYETDAFIMVAAAGGGTGSGGLPVIAEQIKQRYPDKPLYAIIVLPFEHEENTEERCVYNSATCLNSIYPVADAVFVVDNQRFLRKDSTLINNMDQINRQIVEPFFNLFCAGEEKKRKHIGARVVDAGDIIQTLEGWTVIGFGRSQLPMVRVPFWRKRNFREKSTETHKGIESMDEAISELSVNCRPEDAGSALYLLSAPTKEMNMDIVKEIGDYLKELAANATIRSGDYPREASEVNITLILSQLSAVDRVKDIYTRTNEALPVLKRRQQVAEQNLRDIAEAAKDIPSLL